MVLKASVTPIFTPLALMLLVLTAVMVEVLRASRTTSPLRETTSLHSMIALASLSTRLAAITPLKLGEPTPPEVDTVLVLVAEMVAVSIARSVISPCTRSSASLMRASAPPRTSLRTTRPAEALASPPPRLLGIRLVRKSSASSRS